ncbi:S8 family peptidase [Candidatus Nitrosocosmicus sp. T]
MSIFSTSIVQSVDAFNIGLPDIPFLNFGFDNNSPQQEDSSSIIDFETVVTNIIPKSNSDDGDDQENTDDTDPLLDTVDRNDGEGQANNEESKTQSASLPFPSNLINTVYSDENENPNEMNKASLKIPDTLPLIGDYTDIPSAFLSDVETSTGNVIPGQYIVVFNDDDTTISDFLSTISNKIGTQGIELLQSYENVLNGLAIRVPNEKVIEIIEQLPMVDYVEKDVMAEAFAQTLPTGINRIDGDLSSTRSGNGAGTVDVDIAILDTGIDLKHSDLNIYHQKSFETSSSGGWSLFFGSGKTTTSPANDDNGHGTHVAGIAAAKDNSIGSVGVAPGAKLWAIKVLDKNGSGALSTIIKGIDYVTNYANQVEVANLSLGCECKSAALDTAINNSVKAGITFVAAAGNAGKDASSFSPANNPNVLAISAIGDSDGKCGSKGAVTGYGNDDTLASFSNYGSVLDLAAPGAKIYSTYKGNSYATMSGTSTASPHVAGAAALYMASNPDASPSAVRNALVNGGSLSTTPCDGNGNGYFTGDKDQFREPLIYVKNY